MNSMTGQALSVFDLLARQWQRRAAIEQMVFNAASSAVAILDGANKLAITALKDGESAASRIKKDEKTGHYAIHPRKKAQLPLIEVSLPVSEPVSGPGEGAVEGPVEKQDAGNEAAKTAFLMAYNAEGFAVIGRQGKFLTYGASGAETGSSTIEAGVLAAAGSQDGSMIAIGYADHIVLRSSDKGIEDRQIILSGTQFTGALSFSPDGRYLAIGHGNGHENGQDKEQGRGLVVYELSKLDEPAFGVSRDGVIKSLQWSDDNAWIACELEKNGFLLVNAGTGKASPVTNYPLPVRSLSWSKPANALATSGAFRPIVWSMDAPPVDGDTSGNIVAGPAGMVAVETVSAHPVRNLLAFGLVDGQVGLAKIGLKENYQILPPTPDQSCKLVWAPNGKLLAIGTNNGKLALVEFPSKIFK